MLPRPGDDKGWQEFQEAVRKAVRAFGGVFAGVFCDVRQLIIDAAAREAAAQTRGKGGWKKVDEDNPTTTTKPTEGYSECGSAKIQS